MINKVTPVSGFAIQPNDSSKCDRNDEDLFPWFNAQHLKKCLKILDYHFENIFVVRHLVI
jgi:hypothetical protein